MISELTDEEILEYLMTSEFIENYNTDEYKYLLHKFRYFYRILHGNFSRHKGDSEFLIQNFQKEIENIKKERNNDLFKIKTLQDQIDLNNKPRKLTYKERLTGKYNPI